MEINTVVIMAEDNLELCFIPDCLFHNFIKVGPTCDVVGPDLRRKVVISGLLGQK